MPHFAKMKPEYIRPPYDASSFTETTRIAYLFIEPMEEEVPVSIVTSQLNPLQDPHAHWEKLFQVQEGYNLIARNVPKLSEQFFYDGSSRTFNSSDSSVLSKRKRPLDTDGEGNGSVPHFTNGNSGHKKRPPRPRNPFINAIVILTPLIKQLKPGIKLSPGKIVKEIWYDPRFGLLRHFCTYLAFVDEVRHNGQYPTYKYTPIRRKPTKKSKSKTSRTKQKLPIQISSSAPSGDSKVSKPTRKKLRAENGAGVRQSPVQFSPCDSSEASTDFSNIAESHQSSIFDLIEPTLPFGRSEIQVGGRANRTVKENPEKAAFFETNSGIDALLFNYQPATPLPLDLETLLDDKQRKNEKSNCEQAYLTSELILGYNFDEALSRPSTSMGPAEASLNPVTGIPSSISNNHNGSSYVW